MRAQDVRALPARPSELTGRCAWVHHDVCESGETAIRWRSAFSIIGGYWSFFHFRSASATAWCANDFSARFVGGVRRGLPQYASARSSSFSAFAGALASSLRIEGRSTGPARFQRARNEAVSSQRVSSQPETFGG